MDTNSVLASLGISAGLGFLVGMQRQKAGSRFGGIRTFPLITVLGTVTALLSRELNSGWLIAAGLIAIAAIAIVSNFLTQDIPERTGGMTTEVAALLMFCLGAYSVFGRPEVVMAIGVGVAVLLYAKEGLHRFTSMVGEKDMRAIMLFAAITFIILPVLPDKAYGPLAVLNPHNVWLMVVLVVGISLGGYIAYKIFGAGAGAVLSGILGGLISSTATTATYSRYAADNPRNARAALLVIVIAGTIVFARVLAEVSIVAPEFLKDAAPPLLIMLAVSSLLSTGIWVVTRSDAGGLSEPENPTQLKSALIFAAMYAIVTLAVAAGERYFQSRGLFVVAAISGLTDMDAITLSTSRMVNEGTISPLAGWRAIIIASISNITFKTGIIASLGGKRLLRLAAITATVQAAVGAGLLIFWS